MATLRHRALIILFVTTISFFATSCSKKEDAQLSQQPSNLMSRIPPTSVGFFSWRSDQPQYQKIRKENWSDWTTGFLKTVEQSTQSLGEEDAQRVKAVVTVLEQSGLIPKSADQPDPIKEGVFFLDFGAQNNTPSFGLYVEGYPQVNFETLLTNSDPLIKQQGIEVEASSANGRKILKIQPPKGTDKNNLENVFVVATKDKLAIVNILDAADRLFTENKDDGYKVISSTPSYQKGTKLLTSNGEQFAFGYLDVVRVASYAKTLPDGANNTDLALLPVESLAIKQSVKDGINVRGVITLEPKDDKQKLLLSNLSKKPENNLVDGTPEDSALFLALDRQLLQTVKEGALSEVSDEEKQAASVYMTMFDSIKGIGLMLRQGSGDSPFPDLAIIAQSSTPEKTYQSVKDLTLDVLSTQLGIQKWMEKKIEGTAVNYVMTPLGIGMYLASSGDKLIVTSSDSAMQKVLSTSNKNAGSLATKIKSQSVKTDGFVTSFISFEALAQLIEAVEGSMAMFTGGANTFSAADIQNLKRLGNAFGGISIQEGSLVLDALMTYAPKAS